MIEGLREFIARGAKPPVPALPRAEISAVVSELLSYAKQARLPRDYVDRANTVLALLSIEAEVIGTDGTAEWAQRHAPRI